MILKPHLLAFSAVLIVSPALVFAQSGNQQPPNPDNQSAAAQAEGNNGTYTPEQGGRIVQQLQHKLLSLPDYDVFDSLGFSIQGRTIILRGYASRPQLKSEAEKAVKSIPGVENVQNQIQVLPFSPNDDRIRIGVYRRIYGFPSLRKYTSAPVGFGAGGDSVALAAGGITNDPPLGYHAIHIIVNNGHVMLTGVVDSKADSDAAYIQANSTPGAFSVTNELQVAGKRQNPEKPR